MGKSWCCFVTGALQLQAEGAADTEAPDRQGLGLEEPSRASGWNGVMGGRGMREEDRGQRNHPAGPARVRGRAHSEHDGEIWEGFQPNEAGNPDQVFLFPLPSLTSLISRLFLSSPCLRFDYDSSLWVTQLPNVGQTFHSHQNQTPTSYMSLELKNMSGKHSLNTSPLTAGAT